MSRRLQALSLFAAFVVPTLLLAWIGLRSLREENQRGAARYAAQADSIARAVASEVEREVGRLQGDAAEDGEALAIAFGPDGSWLGPLPPPARGAESGEPQLAAALSNEIDRLQAQGDLDGAALRLAEIAESADAGELVAWALDARAVLLERLGRAEDARTARRELIERRPDERNADGLKRSFAARFALASEEASPERALLALYADLVRDYGELGETQTAEFLRRVRGELGARCATDPTLAAELEAEDREDARRSRARTWLATLRTGPSDWAARGAPGGPRLFAAATARIPALNPLSLEFEAEPSPPGRGTFVAALRPAEGVLRGAALELDRLFARALAAVSRDAALAGLGFAAGIERRAGAEDAVALLALAPPLDEYAVAVRGGDFASFQAGERRRFALLAGMVALALFSAALGAWFTLRGVAREVEAARGREAFVAAVTHELKTPLAAIRLFAEMQERGGVEPEKVREFGARTVAESDRLARLVDSVLDLARIEHAGSGAPRASVELAALGREAVRIVESVAREKGFQVVLREPAPAVRVRADRDALVRAIVNLLDNAEKYGDPAQPIEVEVVARGDGTAEVAVLDRGRGVPDSERERIFEPFRRVGSELTREAPGVGLGLALVAKIAAAHGGRATCEAREGGGSRFAIRLPAAGEEHA